VATASGITWRSGQAPSDLARSVARFGERFWRAVVAVAQLFATEAENDAKTHAPWTDRTGNARQGLHGLARELGERSVAIYLYHAMEYGKWLELAHGAKWQIILPTLEQLYSRVMAAIRQAFAGG
jgi:hypothetical protein